MELSRKSEEWWCFCRRSSFFFFIGLMEDTGYLPRIAFMMDRLMSRVGLSGKSFAPLLSSHACAVPAIIGARTIEHEKDRLITILVAPWRVAPQDSPSTCSSLRR